MRVLVVGGGGREHALTWKLAQSPQLAELFAAPGNPGMAAHASCVPIGASDIVELADFAASVRVDLTIVGPELPLALGIVDEFQKRGMRIVGPTQAAAELEASKVFSKEFMRAAGIPTADFWIAHGRADADRTLASSDAGWPVVLKADGLAAGKGVIIAKDRAEADAALTDFFENRAFGTAAESIVIEKCLQGTEVSFHVLTDGETVVPLASAQDYKRLADQDQGPNTGGMGTVSPSPRLTKETQGELLRRVVIPTLEAMKTQGRVFRGVLYVGAMLTADGPKVLEYNCRLGDPETQVLLTRLEGDLLAILSAAADGRLADVRPKWAHHAAVCVVMAAPGYPARPELGRRISGVADAEALEGVRVFHAGTKRDGEGLVTHGGRVLGVTAASATLTAARQRALEAVALIHFEGSQHRRDIGADLVEFLHERR